MNWRTAARIAWREIVASRGKFVFIALAVAVGVGSLAGVRGFGRSFRIMLAAEARTLMAADLSVRVFDLPNPEQEAELESLDGRHVERTSITETVTMASIDEEHYPVLVSIKAVDPHAYPFYGEVELNPPGRLSDRLGPDSVGVSEDLLIRLDAKVGDQVRLGAADFRIAAVVVTEPDRMTGSLNVGPRVLMTRDGLDRADIMREGSRGSQRQIFRFDAGAPPVQEVRTELEAAFPRALIADYRQVHPLIERGLSRSERFLSLIGLIALIVGALGVAATIHAHLEQRLDTIAILKCMGARNTQVLRIYAAQTLIVAFAGGILGALLGGAVQAAFPFLISKYFSLTPTFRWDFWASLEGITIGLLTAFLFTIPVLLSVKRIKPLVILRRDFENRATWYATPGPWIAGGVIILGVCAIAGWLAGGDWNERLRVGGYFAGGLVVSLITLTAVAWGILRGLRALVRTSSSGWPLNLRHGVANIFRPGNQAEAVLVSLGLGVMFTMTVYFMQVGLLDQLLASAPPDSPNVFMVNITERERPGVQDMLREQQAVIQGTPDVISNARAQLESIDGVAIADLGLDERTLNRYEGPRTVTFEEELQDGANILNGKWWTPDESGSLAGQVCVIDDEAEQLGIKPGAHTVWTADFLTIEADVACIYRSEQVRIGSNYDFVFSPGTLDGVPMQNFAALRMTPSAIGQFQKISFARFPSVTVINGADVVEIIQEVVDQIALVVRFISAFAIVAGIIILASSVASTRFRRVREVAILKTLGAQRGRISRIFSVEFLILGALAGLFGSALAAGFSNLVLVNLLEAQFRLDYLGIGAAVVFCAVVANAAGWLASWRILGEKPLEVLRGE